MVEIVKFIEVSVGNLTESSNYFTATLVEALIQSPRICRSFLYFFKFYCYFLAVLIHWRAYFEFVNEGIQGLDGFELTPGKIQIATQLLNETAQYLVNLLSSNKKLSIPLNYEISVGSLTIFFVYSLHIAFGIIYCSPREYGKKHH